MPLPILSQEFLRSILEYSPETGIFVWKKRPPEMFPSVRACNVWNSRYSGRVAGHKTQGPGNLSYITIRVLDRSYKAHRLAWGYMTGEFPEVNIDHIDGNGTNNKWSNLREADWTENMRNCRISKNNTTGYHGIEVVDGKYRVRITVNYKTITLGRSVCIHEARRMRQEAEKKYGFHPNHGRAG